MYKLKLIKTQPTNNLFIVRKCFLSSYNAFTLKELKLILSFKNNPEILFKIKQIDWTKSVRENPLSRDECSLISKYLTATKNTCFIRHYTKRPEYFTKTPYENIFLLRPNSLKLFPRVECSRGARSIALEFYYMPKYSKIVIAETSVLSKQFLYLRYIYKLEFFKRQTKNFFYYKDSFTLEDVLKIKAYVYKGPGAYKEFLSQLNAVSWQFSTRTETLQEIHHLLIYYFITDTKHGCFNRKSNYFYTENYQGPDHIINVHLRSKNSDKSCFLIIYCEEDMICIKDLYSSYRSLKIKLK